MEWGFLFFVNSVFLGVGLAMDAFSVSMANGLNDPGMGKGKMCGIAGVFAGFQFAMPLVGWICVHTIVQAFQAFEEVVPWIALALLAAIGGDMLAQGIRGKGAEEEAKPLGIAVLLVQGVATSIDALSVGFTIAEYDWPMALAACLLIAAVTFVICMAGLMIGKRFGTRLSNRAQILGGVILIVIGVEIFASGVWGG